MSQLEHKVAFVTGGAAGIGAACAMTLARAGAKLVITDLDDARGSGVAGEITGLGGDALYLHQDVTDEAHWSDVMGAVDRRFGRLDIMVANAGIAVRGSLLEMSLADWRRQTAVNLDGVFLSVKHAIPPMRRTGGGSIIVMSSVAGLRGAPQMAGYCATKGGVRLFAKAAAMECAEARDNIRVNSVHPGIIDTEIWSKMTNWTSSERRNAPLDPHAIAAAGVPLGHAAVPQDIADAVLFLASDASRHMTGSEIVVDGGMTGGAVRRP